MSGFRVEHRHPLTDLRVVEFALRLPPVPWCVDKELFRTVMAGVLPPAVVRRPKAPLAGDPTAAGISGASAPLVRAVADEIREFIAVRRYLDACERVRLDRAAAARLAYQALDTAALNGWLRSPARHRPQPPSAP